MRGAHDPSSRRVAAVDGLVGLVTFVALIAVLTGSRRRHGRPPAPSSWLGPAREDEPKREPWPYPTVPGLVQPESPHPHLRMLHEFLKEKWRTDIAMAASPECVATALRQMAESGVRNCSRLGIPDLGRRFGLLRDRLRSQLRCERGISQAESQAAIEEMTLLISTVAAMGRGRYVG